MLKEKSYTCVQEFKIINKLRNKFGTDMYNEYLSQHPICRECGKLLGYIDLGSKRTYKTSYYSFMPFELNNIMYLRDICFDCFYIKFNRKPKTPTKPNNDFVFLMGAPLEEIKKRNSKFSVTRQNMIEKYGEKEGNIKFDKYCKRQSYTNSEEYYIEKYGISEGKIKHKKFRKDRGYTYDSCIKKHGEKNGSEIFDKYCKRQSYTNSEEYYIEKYGISEGKIKHKKFRKDRGHTLDNYIKKYGNNAEYKLNEFHKKTKSGKFYSKVANSLFVEIFSALPDELKDKTYFGKNEYGKQYNGKYYLYDFIISSIKFCIEFNGDIWHANPTLYSADSMPLQKFNIKNANITASEIWERDRQKIKYLENDNFKVLTIWEKDYNNNKMQIFSNILNEISVLIDEKLTT